MSKGTIANKMWSNEERRAVEDELDAVVKLQLSSAQLSATCTLWRLVRVAIKPTKDVLEGELYDKNSGETK